MKTELVAITLCIFFFLTSCTIEPETPPAPTVIACKSETSGDKGLCVENTIRQLEDKDVAKCAELNIDGKPELSKHMQENTLTDGEINDIDGLIRSCMGYFDTNPEKKAAGESPMFGSFASSLAGSFVGTMLGNSLYDSITDYNRPGFNRSSYYNDYHKNSNYSSGRATVVPNTGGSTSTTTPKSSVTIPQKQPENIKTVPKTTPTKTYSLGDTGSKWAATSQKYSAPKSSSTPKSTSVGSRSSSSSSSSLS